MDTPTELQAIEVELLGSDEPSASIAMGFLYSGGIRQAYLSVRSSAGVTHTITYNMAVDGIEHTLRADMAGLTFSFYVDGVLRGTHTAAAASLSTVDYVLLSQQPIVGGSIMSVSKVEIENCP